MAPRAKTRDRIIEASLELFNAQGERAVTTNHIAQHLGISPGNLYYHFRNKQAIVAELFGAYERRGVSSAERLPKSALIASTSACWWLAMTSWSASSHCRRCSRSGMGSLS